MLKAAIAFLSLVLLMSCNYNKRNNLTNQNAATPNGTYNGSNIYENILAIPVPDGFKRVVAPASSFSNWLHLVRLKKDKTVYLYNGNEKANQHAQFAVLDISVGNKDLQQCADAVMRLRAEYLFHEKRFGEISFTDNDNKNYSFTEPYSAEHFSQYLNRVFSACGSASLSKQLHSKNITDLKAGDVLIRGGFPGHAVIVIDVAVNDKNEKVFMIAQSYMPAQDIQILVNPKNKALSPWYKVDTSNDLILTPEYAFHNTELKQW